MHDIVREALKIMESEFTESVSIDRFGSSAKVRDYCRLQLAHEPNEVFGVMFLNTHFNMLGFEKMFYGTIHESIVYFRPIMRKVFEYNASRIILTHNHPSGVAEPSEADKGLTQRMAKSFIDYDCKLLDHIIVTKKGTYSFAEAGLL